MAGHVIGLDDGDYEAAGASIAETAEAVFAEADLIVKVKEPSPRERAMLREGQILFTYLHLAPDPDQAKALMESGCIAIAYETVTDSFGGLPLAHADERGGGPDGDSGGRPLSGAGAGRARHASRRRARHAIGPCCRFSAAAWSAPMPRGSPWASRRMSP